MSAFLTGNITNVKASQIIDGAITTAKIAASAVTEEKTSGLPVDKDIRALALEVADLRGIALNFPNGAADPFDSDTLATKTHATYDASSDYYHNPGTGYTDSFITPSLTYTAGSGDVTNLANLADGNTGTEAGFNVPLPNSSVFFKVDVGAA